MTHPSITTQTISVRGPRRWAGGGLLLSSAVWALRSQLPAAPVPSDRNFSLHWVFLFPFVKPRKELYRLCCEIPSAFILCDPLSWNQSPLWNRQCASKKSWHRLKRTKCHHFLALEGNLSVHRDGFFKRNLFLKEEILDMVVSPLEMVCLCILDQLYSSSN